MLKELAARGLDWIDYARRGPSDEDKPRMLRIVYRWWMVAFALKLLGSSWDVSWHFKWIRDDFAPPHLLNTAGTIMVIVLVVCHTYTGFGVDKLSLRTMQFGTIVFLLSIPVDVINHALNGLDITAWSFSHAGLYTGTAIMIVGAARAWWLFGPRDRIGEWRLIMGGLWLFFFENTQFPNQHQEYGVLSITAWDRGAPYAEPSLLDFAAQQLGMPVGRGALVGFALPVPDWVYLTWIVGAVVIALVVARKILGVRYAATAIAGAYVAYRAVMWGLLTAADFPPSAVPFALLAAGIAIDLAMLRELPWWAEAAGGAALTALVTAGALWVQGVILDAPPTDWRAIGYGALALAALWGTVNAVARTEWWARHMRVMPFAPRNFPLMRNPVAESV